MTKVLCGWHSLSATGSHIIAESPSLQFRHFIIDVIYEMEPDTERFEEAQTISGLDLLHPSPQWNQRRSRRRILDIFTILIFLIAFIALILSAIALNRTRSGGDDDDEDHKEYISIPTHLRSQLDRGKLISRIAFGSCTSYYRHPQTFWATGVIPSDPDAWIWLGDFLYLDTSMDDCPFEGYENITDCNCEVTAMHNPPRACFAGNLSFAQEKTRLQLIDDDYYTFLQYMCPNMNKSVQYPPIGDLCERPILGTYDDHDFGWNNGNRYLLNKYGYKNLFLDALGVEKDSERRRLVGGIEYKYTINSDRRSDQQIDVFLLDERYNRDALPCSVRRRFCRTTLRAHNESTFAYQWCHDYLRSGGPAGEGSCCKADDLWANGWCETNERKDHDGDLWDVACDPSSEQFGSMFLEVNETTNQLIPKTTYDRSDLTYSSTFCDVLGVQQRRWFHRELTNSNAALKLIVSGSVLIGNPIAGEQGPCSSDDIECYKVAQSNLIHILNQVDKGCILVLTGDYHQSDIKIIQANNNEPYADYYPTDDLRRPIYQVMASGLTEVTATGFRLPNPCRTWRNDTVGLRPLGQCSHVARPAFGMINVDWENRAVHLELHSTEDGEIANGVDGSPNHISINLDTCQRI